MIVLRFIGLHTFLETGTLLYFSVKWLCHYRDGIAHCSANESVLAMRMGWWLSGDGSPSGHKIPISGILFTWQIKQIRVRFSTITVLPTCLFSGQASMAPSEMFPIRQCC